MRKRLLLSLLLLASALAWPSHAQPSDEVKINDEARKQFGVGVNLLADPAGPRYQEAYDAFLRAYREAPSPKILSNLGLCAMMLERDGEAIEAYSRYLTKVKDIDPRERDKIGKDLEILEARGGTVKLTVSPAEALLVDTRVPASGPEVVNRYPIEDGAMTLRLRAGTHRIELSAEGYRPAELTVEIDARETISRAVDLAPLGEVSPPAPAPPAPAASPAPATPAGPPVSPGTSEAGGGPSAAAIVTLVLTGAVAVGAGVTGGLALKAKADYESYETGGDRADAESVRSTGETLNIVTDVLIGTAAAGAVVTLVLLLTTSSGDAEDQARWRILPGLVEGGPGLVLQSPF